VLAGVTATGDPIWLVAWSDDRQSAVAEWDIYAQFLESNLDRIGFNFEVTGGGATGGDAWPALARLPGTGEAFAVWTDGRDTTPTALLADVFGQRIAMP
jgi:hypothetical protein